MLTTLLLPLVLCLYDVSGSGLIPTDFSEICNLQSDGTGTGQVIINCQISKTNIQKWRLDTLRDFTTTVHRNQSDRFSYRITCDNTGGQVSIPWPMKCPLLSELTVENCNIVDVFSDFGKDLINTTPDSVTRLEIKNSFMVIKYSNLLRMFQEVDKLTSAYDCIHPRTVQKLTFRNVSYDLVNDVEKEMECCLMKQLQGNPDLPDLPGMPGNGTGLPDLSELPDLTSNCNDSICDMLSLENIIDLPKRLRQLEISCNYENLRELDDSVSSTLSVYHHRFLTKYSKFPALERLNYSHNYIDDIPEEMEDWSFYFNVIKYIDLSYNFIRTPSFKSTFVDKLVNDTVINVQHNNITTMTLEEFNEMKSQRKSYIDMRNNPLICDCDLKDVIVAISNPATFTGDATKYKYMQNMECQSPDWLAGRTLISVDVDDLDCEKSTWVVPFVVLAVIAGVLFTIVLLAFIYRREVRILFYTRLNIQIPGVVYVGLGPKLFHAFVSYSNEDEDWVIDVLCKRLEDPSSSQASETSSQKSSSKSKKISRTNKQFKLCLHARDFVPGMPILENIINSVEQSRHTIIILTENFVQSKWAMEEFYQAYNQSVLERRRHLIIVILGDIADDKMNPILKRCLKTFTYLKVSDKLFYDRLAYSLSTETRMSKEESSKEEEILKSRRSTTTVDIPQEDDSGIFIAGEDVTAGSGHLASQVSVVSTTNSEIGLVESSYL